ncbi:putative ribonuclease H-like domain-containing protein [Tanacetum coccineum]
MTDYSLWEVIKNGNKVLKRTVGETEQEYEPTTAEEKQDRRNEMKARGILLMALPNKDQLKFHTYKDAKLLMEAIEKRYEGNKESKKVQRTLLKQQYENFAGSSLETMDETFDSNSSTNEADNTAYGVSAAHTQSSPTSEDNLSDVVIYAFLDSQPNSLKLSQNARRFIKRTGRKLDVNGQRVGFDRSKVKCYNCHKYAHFARECKAPRNQENRGREINRRKLMTVELTLKNPYQVIDKFKTGLGYNAASSTAASPAVESFVNSSEISTSFLGNFMPCKPDLTFMNKIVKSENLDVTIVVTPSNVKTVELNHESANVKSNGDAVEPKTVRKNRFRPPVIKDWNSDDESEVEIIPKDKMSGKINTGGASVNTAGVSVNTAVRTVNIDRAVSSSVSSKVVSENKGIRANVVKASACWVWKAKHSKGYKEEQDVIDSGCPRNMTGNKCYLTEYEDYDRGFVSFRDGKGRISGKGKIKTGTLDFDNVTLNVLSYLLNFKLLDESQVLLRVPRKDNIYSVDLKSVVPTGGLTCLIAKATIDESNTWHRRLGHINFKTMNKLVKGNLVKGLPSKIFENDHSCVACQKGKQHKASYKTKLVNSISKPLHMLHMDLFGPTNVKSLMKKSYCLVVTDDFSRFSWVFFLATKDETSGILKTFITEIENQLDHKVKVIRSDNGTEFKNSIMNQFCEMKGIKREFSVARTPQQNGVAERKNRTLIEAARTMLVDSKLPTTFWAEAVNTACYVLNRVLVIKPHNKTPYELIRGRPPLIDFMKPFGCPVTILNTRDHLSKFEGKADEGYFVGYSVVSKAIRVFNKRTRIVEETLNIRFLENTPNVKGNGPDWLFDVDSLSISMNYVPVAAGNKTNGIAGTKDNIVAGQAQKEKEPEQEYILIPLCTTDPLISQGPKDSEGDARMKPTEVDENDVLDTSGKHDQEARSASERLNQREMQIEHTNSTNGINTVSTPISTIESSFDTVVPSTPVNVVGPSVSTTNESKEQLFERFSPFKNAFTLPLVPNISSMDNTGIFGNAYDDEDMEEEVDMNNVQALKDPSWVEAMQNELLQFKLLNVWTLVDLPRDKWAIGTKWVFRNKKDERGIVVKNKARLVAQGHTQEEGINYDKVFEPVARIEAIRLFLAYSSFKDFVVYQIDVKSAFLYGKIEEEVYVCQPPSFEDPHFPDKVYKVEKALYGLHQAPRAWYETMLTYLLDNDFYRGQIDKILFIERHKDDILLVQVYVDDIIFGSTKKQMSNEFETLMHNKFQMSSMGELSFFLGLQVKQKSDGIFISQDKYVAEILKIFDFASVKTASTPMETNKALVKDKEVEDVDVHLSRQ